MRPDGVVVEPPFGQRRPGMGERGEQGLVQQFVAQAAVEALDKSILLRLAWGEVVPNTALLRPVQDRVRGQLSAVVGNADGRLATAGDDSIELTSEP